MGRHLGPRYGHTNTDQQIPCFDSCQLTTTWMYNIRLQAPTLESVSTTSITNSLLTVFSCSVDYDNTRRSDTNVIHRPDRKVIRRILS